jgi:hypothetical protein
MAATKAMTDPTKTPCTARPLRVAATENKETKVSATDKNNTLYEKRDVLISIKEFL